MVQGCLTVIVGCLRDESGLQEHLDCLGIIRANGDL